MRLCMGRDARREAAPGRRHAGVEKHERGGGSPARGASGRRRGAWSPPRAACGEATGHSTGTEKRRQCSRAPPRSPTAARLVIPLSFPARVVLGGPPSFSALTPPGRESPDK
jgi:hypothetical protein